MVFEQYTLGHGKWPKNEAEIKKAALCTSGQYVKWTTLNNMLWNYIIQEAMESFAFPHRIKMTPFDF